MTVPHFPVAGKQNGFVTSETANKHSRINLLDAPAGGCGRGPRQSSKVTHLATCVQQPCYRYGKWILHRSAFFWLIVPGYNRIFPPEEQITVAYGIRRFLGKHRLEPWIVRKKRRRCGHRMSGFNQRWIERFRGYTISKVKVCIVAGVKRTPFLGSDVQRGSASPVFLI